MTMSARAMSTKKMVPMLLVFSGALLAGPRAVSAQACSQTLNPGDSVTAAIDMAAPGSTICLNPGNYGSVSMYDVTKNPRVTVRSTSLQSATFSLTTTDGVNGFTFDSVTLASWDLSGSATRNITVQNTRFIGQADLNLCDVANANILIDNSTFINITVSTNSSEGRLNIAQPGCLGSEPVGVTVTNSLFQNENKVGGRGESDGIQIGAYGVVIGPGNIFRDIRQGDFTRHVDAIQLYGQSHTTITGNYFSGNDPHLGAYDGGDTETITYNIFENSAGSGEMVQLLGHHDDVVSHNSFVVTTGDPLKLIIDAKGGDAISANNLIRDNLFRGAIIQADCPTCTITHNMFSSDGLGSNNITGSPTFVGGINPTTLAGFQLAPGSVGKGAASDGQDMGASSQGRSTGVPPAPTNLRVIVP